MLSVFSKFLGPEVPIEVSYMRVSRFSALIMGFWPKASRTWLDVLHFLICNFITGWNVVGELLYALLNISNLNGFIEAFCPCLEGIMSYMKLTLFYLNHRNWHSIIIRMRAMLLRDAGDDVEKRSVLEKLASFANISTFALFFCGHITSGFYNVRPLILNGFRLWQGKDWEYMLPFKMVVPPKWDELPIYAFSYFLGISYGFISACTLSAVDGFFLSCCSYTSGLFRILQIDIRNIFRELQAIEYATPEQNRRIRAELREIVNRHNAILDLCTDYSKNFEIVVLMNFTLASVLMCMCIVNMMMDVSSLGIMTYGFYIIVSVTQVFLYCIGGTFVADSSLEIADTMYDVEWYKCDPGTRKMILMLLRRAQKPKLLSVPFFTPSLQTFGAIVRTAGSYITLMNTFL